MTEELTAEELELLATSDEDIRKLRSVLSFDADRFTSRIWEGEPWQQLLQAHLYLDHVVSLLIRDALHKPEAIKTNRMGFYQKMQFVEGMALLPEPIVRSIQGVNSLRNKVAHDLNLCSGAQ